jgi:hypothetical protein
MNWQSLMELVQLKSTALPTNMYWVVASNVVSHFVLVAK